jgi:hypothetical protein
MSLDLSLPAKYMSTSKITDQLMAAEGRIPLPRHFATKGTATASEANTITFPIVSGIALTLSFSGDACRHPLRPD